MIGVTREDCGVATPGCLGVPDLRLDIGAGVAGTGCVAAVRRNIATVPISNSDTAMMPAAPITASVPTGPRGDASTNVLPATGEHGSKRD